ncbi:low affinity potassium transporter [Ascosphaera aggregata]|nr:low affinity potassium transporter [Ascosphaera aggregata]
MVIQHVVTVVSWLQDHVPGAAHIRLNFITLHYTYIIATALVSAVIIYVGSDISFIDALFMSTGSATQSGLNVIDLNVLHTYQQFGLFFVTMITTPIFVNTVVVFVRLFWFEKRFQHIVQDVKNFRRTRSRSIASATNSAVDEERGIRGRPIIVLRDSSGQAEGHPTTNLEPESEFRGTSSSSSCASSPTKCVGTKNENPKDSEDRMRNTDGREHHVDEGDDNRNDDDNTDDENDNNVNKLASEHPGLDLRGMRLPAQMSPDQHIAFLERQRQETGALRIPSPREFDRGGFPTTLDETSNDEEGNDLKQRATTRSEDDGPRSPTDTRPPQQHGQSSGPHITIEAPAIRPSRTRATTMPRSLSRTRTFDSEGDFANNTPFEKRRRRMSQMFRSLTQSKEEENLPYLSWQPTIGRNSAFIDLTEEQRDELGGIEYRSLKKLAIILVSYYVFFHTLGFVCLCPWILGMKSYGKIVTDYGQGRPWWALFTSASSFNDLGYTLTPDSMVSFNDSVFPLLLLGFLIVIGNTGFPCMLRFIIWVLSKLVPRDSATWEELRFLLDHPRRCFTLLFPRGATWWLVLVLLILNGVDVIFFVILDLNDAVVSHLPGGLKFLDGLFQAIATRTAGLSVVSITDLHPAIQVSYMVMMYISVLPIAISVRRTNVYEERSLGVYYDNDDEDNNKEQSYVGAHLRRQLSFDMWYIFLGLFIIAIVESARLRRPDFDFNLFTVLFEIVSAYGTVGLSLGYPNTTPSFSAQFKALSKLVIIAMEVRGRHRGLPYDLDRAILLPSEGLHLQEQKDAERRMRRRPSGSTMNENSLGPGLGNAPTFDRNFTFGRSSTIARDDWPDDYHALQSHSSPNTERYRDNNNRYDHIMPENSNSSRGAVRRMPTHQENET